jgi:Cd2+/Zn2+-exporting ATPase
VESTTTAGETTLAHIIRLVAEAQSRRAPSEIWVDRFARIYTPAVFVTAGLVFLVPPLLAGVSWTVWTYRALVLLVIGCPCALVISTPVTIVAALASAARSGVLIKGGVFVEAPAQVKAVALDKTGTLTEGRPTVTNVIPLNGHSDAELIARAAGLEVHTDHPLARAIVEYARTRKSQIREHFHVQSARNVSEIVYELRNIIRESENVQLLPYSRLRLARNCFSGPAIRCRAEHTDAAPLAQEHAPTLRD